MSLNLEINWRHMNEQWVIKLLLLRPTSKDENIKARGFLTCEGLVEAVNGRRTSTYLDVLPGLYNLLRKRGIDMMVASEYTIQYSWCTLKSYLHGELCR